MGDHELPQRRVLSGIVWAIYGLGAGSLHGLWAGRGMSARRLKGIGPLLPPDSPMLLAWADGGITEQAIAELSTPDTQSLVLRFNPTGHAPCSRSRTCEFRETGRGVEVLIPGLPEALGGANFNQSG